MSGINRLALYFSTFPQIFYFFLKDPGPLNNKKRFSAAKQLSICSLIESRCFHWGVSDQFVSIPGGCLPLSSSIPGGLGQNRNYEEKKLSRVGR